MDVVSENIITDYLSLVHNNIIIINARMLYMTKMQKVFPHITFMVGNAGIEILAYIHVVCALYSIVNQARLDFLF